MEINDVINLIKSKELAELDWGSVKIVRPTGRYIDTSLPGSPELLEPRLRFMVEVISTRLSAPRWVPAVQLKYIQATR